MNNAFVSVRASRAGISTARMRAFGPTFRRKTRLCNIRYSCARRVPDVRLCAARVGAAWCRVERHGMTWHRIGRTVNWDERDVALRGTRPCRSRETAGGAVFDACAWYGSLVMKCTVNRKVHVANNTRVCDETSRAGVRTQCTDENKAEQHRIHTHAMRSRCKALCVWLAQCDGTSATYT